MDRYEGFETLLEDSSSGSPVDPQEFAPGADPSPASGFSPPPPLPPRTERTMRGIAETFARAGAGGLGAFLRSPCTLRLLGLRSARTEEILAGLPPVVCASLIRLVPLPGAGLITIDAPLMTSMLTRLLGGPVEEPAAVREFTALDLRIARGVVERLLEDFRRAAATAADFDPRVERIESTPGCLAALEEGDAMVTLRYAVTLHSVEGVLELHVPLAGFTPADPDGVAAAVEILDGFPIPEP